MENPTSQPNDTTDQTSKPPLGMGRAKVKPTATSEHPAPAQWTNSNFESGASNSKSFSGSGPSNNDGYGDWNNQRNRGDSDDHRRDQDRSGSGNDRRTGGRSNVCYNCQQPGHISRDCKEPRSENRSNNRGQHGPNRDDRYQSDQRTNNYQRNDGYSKSWSNSGSGGFSSLGASGSDKNSTNHSWNSALKGGNENNSESNTFGKHEGGGSNSNHDSSSHQRREQVYTNSTLRGDSSRSKPGEHNHRDNHTSDDRRKTDYNENPKGGAPVDRYIPPPPPTSVEDIFGEAVEKGSNIQKYHAAHVQCTPEGKVKPIDVFDEANLDPKIQTNIRRCKYDEPTAIQRYALPCIQGRLDLMACAQTGSGKTAAFLIPIISNLLQLNPNELQELHNPPAPLCLVLSPTRELALQTEREARKFGYQTSVCPCSVIGGHDFATITERLRQGCHILSATTGRLKDMVTRGTVSLKNVKYLVLDEADRMLDEGFEPDLRELERLGLPSKDQRITAMFSATFPAAVQQLAANFLRKDYVFLVVGRIGGANEDITQTIEEVPGNRKKDRLFDLLEEKLKNQRCLIFVETKRSADYLGTLLSQKSFMSTTMHGDRTQRQRSEAVQQFTDGRCPILVATSVAARGLDFPLIGFVVNYDLPDTADFYIHRIGRTGRAGHLGQSISFFDPDRDSDRAIAPQLVEALSSAGQPVPDFLKRYESGGDGTTDNTVHHRNQDIRHHGNTFSNRGHPSKFHSGGSRPAGAADENWDNS